MMGQYTLYSITIVTALVYMNLEGTERRITHATGAATCERMTTTAADAPPHLMDKNGPKGGGSISGR